MTLVALVAGCSSTSGPEQSVSKRAPVTTVTPHPSGPSAGCRASAPAKAGTTDTTIVSGGKKRSYELIVPTGATPGKPLPLIFALHSLTIDYHLVPSMSGLTGHTGDHDYFVVSPSGLLGQGNKPYWNAAPVMNNDDVKFIADLLDHLESTLCVDTAQVFSIGMSNGAQMSSLLACRLDGRIDSIGVISGVEYNRPCPSPPTPVMAVHGTKDPFVPYGGGGLNSVTIADRNYYHGKVPAGTPKPPGVDASMAGWAAHNGCGRAPTTTRISAEVQRRTWSGCAAVTELYIIDGGGHAWPGMCFPGMEKTFGHCTDDIDATKLILAMMFGTKR